MAKIIAKKTRIFTKVPNTKKVARAQISLFESKPTTQNSSFLTPSARFVLINSNIKSANVASTKEKPIKKTACIILWKQQKIAGLLKGSLAKPSSSKAPSFLNYQFLLQLRSNLPHVVYGGTFAIFGGHCKKGENGLTTALREFKEETGISLDRQSLAFLGIVYDTTPACVYEQHIYHTPIRFPLTQIALKEGSGFALLDYSQLSLVPMSTNTKTIIEQFIRQVLATKRLANKKRK